MDDSLHMTISNAGQYLVDDFLNFIGIHELVAQRFQVRLQVTLHILEYEVELLLVYHHIFQLYDVLVLNLPQ